MLDVIITTYNNPDSLKKTLASLVAQTNEEFAVTVIDDASTQDYSDVIDSYKKLLDLNYIKNKNNVGPGLSRQVGVDNSYEEYFIFVDSDDVLCPYAVQVINEGIMSGQLPDLIVGEFYTQVLPNEQMQGQATSLMKSGSAVSTITWHHGKVYRRRAITKYGIKVPEEFSYVGDDAYYNALCIELLPRKVQLQTPYYVWVQNSSSLTHTRNLKKEDEQTFVVNSLMSAAKDALKHVDKLTILDKSIISLLEKNKYSLDDSQIKDLELLGIEYNNTRGDD